MPNGRPAIYVPSLPQVKLQLLELQSKAGGTCIIRILQQFSEYLWPKSIVLQNVAETNRQVLLLSKLFPKRLHKAADGEV